MKRIFLSVCVVILVVAHSAYALDVHTSENIPVVNALAFINTLKTENTNYYTGHKIDFFAGLAKGQYPVATVVACSDSRVQINMLEPNPEGKFFVVRNIGNQLATAEGSVEYGIHQLHTPILLIVGHSRCATIAAVNSNYSKESPAIKRELDTIAIGKDLTNMEGVKANIHNQVAAAMLKFDDELKDGKLTVIGAVLDFADDLHQGAGKLNIININGETDSGKLENPEGLIIKSRAPGAKQRKKAAR